MPDHESRFLISEKLPFLMVQWVLTTKVEAHLFKHFVSSAFLGQTYTAMHCIKAFLSEG